MKKIVFFAFILISINSFGQKLTKSETIEILTKNNHSEKIISKALETNLSFQEIEQINTLKNSGISDEVLNIVIDSRSLISSNSIKEIIDFQTKGYSLDLISKYINNLPKSSKLKKSTQGKFQIGVNAGLQSVYFDNYTQLTNVEQVDDFRVILGVATQFEVSKRLWISSAINYEQKGNRFEKIGNVKSVANIRIHYMNVPVTLNFGIGSKNKLYLGLGGYGSLAVSKPTYINHGVTYQNIKLQTNAPIDFGSIIGVGYKLKAKDINNFFVELRYSQGFRDVRMNDIFVRNKNIGILIGATVNKRNKKR